jgi:curved DNA-binding protein CbpA
MNPYQILEVDKNCTIQELRHSFKKIAQRVHPDKGGNEAIFNIVVEAYKEIFKKLKNKLSDKNFNELKNDSLIQIEQLNKKKHVSFNETSNSPNEEFIEKFNEVFESNKFYNPETDDGYGSMMQTSVNTREDINIEKQVRNLKDFNSTFDKQATTNNEISKFREPIAMSSSSSKLICNELGIDKVDDFSSGSISNHKNLGYTDYMKAHTTNKLVDKSAIKQNTKFKNMKDIEKQRSSQNFEMSLEDKKAIDDEITRETNKETQRQINIQKYDNNVTAHFEKLNKLMINNR